MPNYALSEKELPKFSNLLLVENFDLVISHRWSEHIARPAKDNLAPARGQLKTKKL